VCWFLPSTTAPAAPAPPKSWGLFLHPPRQIRNSTMGSCGSDCPSSGKSPNCLSSPFRKNIFVFLRRKSLHRPSLSRTRKRGVSRSSRTLGAGCDGRGGVRRANSAPDEWHCCGRRSRVVLTPRRWRQVGERDFINDGDKQARSPRRARRNPLKPLRREGRVFR
jgi:hypothetical protein